MRFCARCMNLVGHPPEEILNGHRKPGIISLAVPACPRHPTFPVSGVAPASAADNVDGPGALQYAASEGYGPLRRGDCRLPALGRGPDQILITTGSCNRHWT